MDFHQPKQIRTKKTKRASRSPAMPHGWRPPNASSGDSVSAIASAARARSAAGIYWIIKTGGEDRHAIDGAKDFDGVHCASDASRISARRLRRPSELTPSEVRAEKGDQRSDLRRLCFCIDFEPGSLERATAHRPDRYDLGEG